MILVAKLFITNQIGESLMINGLNNDSASLVLDSAMKVNSGFKQRWDEMSCA